MSLKERFPNTFRHLNKLDDAQSVFTHIESLQSGWINRANNLSQTIEGSTSSDVECDLLLAGGGLSILYALVAAKAGFKVIIADKRRVGTAHREWNISYQELEAFVNAEIFSREQIDSLINHRYERGIVKWHGGKEHSVTGVLDCAIDAQALLDQLRDKAELLGVELYDNCSVTHYSSTKNALTVELTEEGNNKRILSTRLLLDGRGALSGNGQFDIVCPTVGGIVSGFETGTGEKQVDSKVGEILISREGIVDGKQHIWEGFPSSKNRLITYLFYYCHPDSLEEEPLFSLYERFFTELHTYKVGEPVVEKPTYGFIPGNTRLSKCELSPCDRVYLVGDASGQHSPLTFCGFGSIVRSFQQVTNSLVSCLQNDKLDSKTLNKVQCEMAGLRAMGGLAIMMMAHRLPPSGDRQSINTLLDDAFSVLSSKGESMYRDFMQDKIKFQDFIPFMLEVAKKRPSVWGEVYSRMSHKELKEYVAQLTKFGLTDFSR